jgi:hypothetical protein
MKLIKLTKGKVAKVDDSDYVWLSSFKWCVGDKGKTNRQYYVAKKYNKETKGMEFMHRFILGAKEGEFVDHKNHDTLDNRRSNLRICTKSENNANSRPKNDIRYRGISFDKKRQLWQVHLGKSGKQYFIGYFKTDKEAAMAYDIKAQLLHGEFAYLNFPLLSKLKP